MEGNVIIEKSNAEKTEERIERLKKLHSLRTAGNWA